MNLKRKNEKGITLVALVVTIVVLIILAVISIGAVFGEDGIIKRAEEARDTHLRGEQNDLDALESLDSQISELIGENGSGGEQNPEQPTEPEGPLNPTPGGKILVTTLTDIQDDEVKAEDDLGNKITVPKGFKVRTDLGDTVQEGIVIEDGIGNQYVWVPVSSTKRDNTENPIIIEKDGVEVEVNIILGRYTFADNSATVPGKETLVQAGEEYANPANYAIDTYYTELNDGTQESNGLNKGEGRNKYSI